MSRRHKNRESPMSFFSFQDIISCVTGLFIMITMLLAMELVQASPNLPRPSNDDARESTEDLRRRRDELKRLVDEDKVRLAEVLKPGALITPRELAALADKVIALEGNVKNVQLSVQKHKTDTIRVTTDIVKAQTQISDIEKRIKELEDKIKVARNRPEAPFPRMSGSGKLTLFVECGGQGIAVGQQLPSGEFKLLARFGPESKRALAGFLAWAEKRSVAGEYFALLIRPDGVDSWQPITGRLKTKGFELAWAVWPAQKPSLFP